ISAKEKKMRRVAWVGFSRIALALGLIIGLELALFSLGVASTEPSFQELMEQIAWEKNAVERLSSPTWQPPEGWELIANNVESVSVINSGSLGGDPATVVTAKRFEEVTGIKVNFIVVPSGASVRRGTTILMSRSTEADVVYVKPYIAKDWERAGWLEPIDFMYQPDPDVPRLYTNANDNVAKFEGHWYATPWMGRYGELLYRKDLLEKYVGTSEPPRTWQELVDYGKKLTGNGVWGFGFYTGDIYPMGFSINFHSLMYSEGVRPEDIVDERGIPHYDTPEAIKALEFMTKLVQEYKISPPAVTTISDTDTYEMFVAGKLAMSFQNTWVNAKLAKKWPLEKWGIAPIPVSGGWEGAPEGTVATKVGPRHYVINPSVDPWKKAAAALFMDCFRSYEAFKNQEVVEGNQSIMPMIYEDPEVIEKVPYSDVIVELGQHAYSTVYNNGAPVVETLMEWGNKAIMGTVSPEEALSEAQEAIEEFFPKK
ncbi:MAG: extracellular solute-binding protein, partial [bacterium]